MLSPNPTSKVTKNLNQSQKPSKNRPTRLSEGSVFEVFPISYKTLAWILDRTKAAPRKEKTI